MESASVNEDRRRGSFVIMGGLTGGVQRRFHGKGEH